MADLESQNDEKSRLRETERTENDCYTKEELLGKLRQGNPKKSDINYFAQTDQRES